MSKNLPKIIQKKKIKQNFTKLQLKIFSRWVKTFSKLFYCAAIEKMVYEIGKVNVFLGFSFGD